MVLETEHFSEAELKCKCISCDYTGMDDDFMAKLEAVRVAYGKPMSISSAHRCPDHNSKVSSTGPNGPHTTRKAIDIRCSGRDAFEILQLAMGSGFTGIGISQKGAHGSRFIHLDTITEGGRPWVWSY